MERGRADPCPGGLEGAFLEWCLQISTSNFRSFYLGFSSHQITFIEFRTMAAKSIPGFDEFETVWNSKSPLE